MKPAAFTLETVFYPEIAVKANPNFERGSSGQPAQPAIKLQVYRDARTDESYHVFLECKKAIDSDADAYELDCLAGAVFTVDGEIPSEERLSTVMRSAPNILYGSLRDYIATITGRGPWGEYYLPAVIIDQDDFVSDHDPVDDAMASQG